MVEGTDAGVCSSRARRLDSGWPRGGRAAAERLGVVAEPEVVTRQLGAATAFIVLASDGVFEFMANQEVVDLVRACAPALGLPCP
jgi:serine/threonine protein phosphatase PrpC